MREIDWMPGALVLSVEGDGASGQWIFRFGDKRYLNVECPWRIVEAGAVVLARRDHHQRFGLPKEIDARVEATKRLHGRAVSRAVVSDVGDLRVEFAGGVCLETFTDSSGYESWTLVGTEVNVVVLGGGSMDEWAT